jgi:trimeric autotransporter adhesin
MQRTVLQRHSLPRLRRSSACHLYQRKTDNSRCGTRRPILRGFPTTSVARPSAGGTRSRPLHARGGDEDAQTGGAEGTRAQSAPQSAAQRDATPTPIGDWVHAKPDAADKPLTTWEKPSVAPQRRIAASRLVAACLGAGFVAALAFATAVRWRNLSGGQTLLPALQAPTGADQTAQTTPAVRQPIQTPPSAAAPLPTAGRAVDVAASASPRSGTEASQAVLPQPSDDSPADPSTMDEPIGWLNASPADPNAGTEDASSGWVDVPPQSSAPDWLASTETAEDDAQQQRQEEQQQQQQSGAVSAAAASKTSKSSRAWRSATDDRDGACDRIPSNSPAAVAVLRATAAAQVAAAEAAQAAAQAATAAADASAAAARVEASGGGSSANAFSVEGDSDSMPFQELDTNIVIAATRTATHAAAVAQTAAKAAASAASAAAAASGPCRGGGSSAGVTP